MTFLAKWISLIVLSATVFLLLATDRGPVPIEAMPAYRAEASGSGTANGKWATADGTFIQWWLVQDWDDEAWARELQALQEAGMNYLVLAPTAFHESDKKSGRGITRTIFPSWAPGYETMKRVDGSAYPDVVDACLRNAQKFDFKVFIGLNFSEEWWSKQYNREWLTGRMQEGNELADELWQRYHRKYAGTFYGWYWCWEVNNSFWRGLNLFNSKELLASALRMQTRYLEDTEKRLPLMLSPYMNRRLGAPGAYAEMWKYVFANSGLREGDIFCPQDSVGAGGLAVEDLPDWFTELRKSVDTLPGLQLWADTETFDITDWTGAPVSRFISQMEAVNSLVDNHITFAYSHYYSPNIVNSGFHNTYLEYVRTGKVDASVPSKPAGFSASRGKDGKVLLRWKAAVDDKGICGYHIYRDGIRIANLQVPRVNTGDVPGEAATSITDTVPKTAKTYRYEVKAYDFAGNISPAAGPVKVTSRSKP
jgi:hypothetical protein